MLISSSPDCIATELTFFATEGASIFIGIKYAENLIPFESQSNTRSLKPVRNFKLHSLGDVKARPSTSQFKLRLDRRRFMVYTWLHPGRCIATENQSFCRQREFETPTIPSMVSLMDDFKEGTEKMVYVGCCNLPVGI